MTDILKELFSLKKFISVKETLGKKNGILKKGRISKIKPTQPVYQDGLLWN